MSKFKKGDRVYIKGAYGGEVVDAKRASVKVKWADGSEYRYLHDELVKCPPVRTPREGVPEKAKKKVRVDRRDDLLRRALVLKKWRPETDDEIEQMLASIPNKTMSKAKQDRMLRKIKGQEPVFARTPAKKKGAKKHINQVDIQFPRDRSALIDRASSESEPCLAVGGLASEIGLLKTGGKGVVSTNPVNRDKPAKKGAKKK